MFVSRERRGRDRFLWLKLACLMLGGVVALIGMVRDSAPLIDIAIVVILAGFALRFLPRKVGEAEVQDLAPESGGSGAEGQAAPRA